MLARRPDGYLLALHVNGNLASQYEVDIVIGAAFLNFIMSATGLTTALTQTITGLDVVWSILMMGVFTIIYATVGGSRAVIWTDVVQVLVMFGGALFAVGFVFWQSGAELPQLMAAAAAEDKTRLLDFSFDLTKATVWGFVFLVVFDVVLTFPKDQVLMQRALSTSDDKAAGRSIWA